MAERIRGLGKRTGRGPWSRGSPGTDPRAPGVVTVMALVGCLTVVLTSADPALGQCVGSPTLTVTLSRTIEVFRVGDFDPSDTHFHPHVFTLMMCNDLTEPREVMLSLRIDSDSYGVLGRGETVAFELAPGTTTISNQDLTEASGDYELEDLDVTPEAEDLEELILELGYLPEGSYCFVLQMKPAGAGPHDFSPITVEDCLTVTNPLNLEIIQPGAPFGGELPIVLSTHPQFQWNSRASRWQVRIAEIEPGDGSGEDIMENVPVYEAELTPGDVFSGGQTGAISWSYPSAGEDLGRGRSYCWQVTALVETSGGTEDVVSEVFCFRRLDAADLAAEPVLEALSAIWPQLLEQLGPQMEGLVPTGMVSLDDQAVDPATLQKIIEAIASGELTVEEIKIE